MKVVIVGGGIAGMAAGTYALQSGMEATIYEMHSISGGNSTSWKRKGYFFEGGMHWLVGSSKEVPMHKIWRELGALQNNNPVHNKDPFLTFMDKEGPICLYRDAQRLKAHLLLVSPEDKGAIDGLIKDIETLGKMSMPVMDIKGVQTTQKSTPSLSMLFSMVRALPRMNRLNKISASEYASRFKHPGIRTLLGSIVGDDDFSATSVAFTLGGFSVGDAGHPEGGSLRMAQNMADMFVASGGTFEYKKRVERVEVKEGRATGVWVDGTLCEADAVIVTADTRVAIDTLFEQPLHEPWMDEMRKNVVGLNCEFICLGVKANLRALPESVIFPLDEPFEHNGLLHHSIGFNNYAAFEGYAPQGCTALTCFFAEDTYDEWKAAKEAGSYTQKKQELAQLVIDQLAQVIPETAGKVEVWDVATPLTYERYCGTWRGSWMSVTKPGTAQQQYPCKSDSIEGLYFAGQRMLLPGGLPVAVSTGREAVQYLCKDTDRVFQSECKN